MKKIIKSTNGDTYEFTSRINSGGFGEIFLGKNVSTNEELVLKTINIDNPDFRTALEREIHITISLSNKNIIKVYQSGYDEDNDQFYLIMPYYKNGSLKDFLDKQTALLPLNTCYDFFDQILSGFSFIHSKSIVHRDVKPQNILISNNGTLLISDFGMAKNVTDATITNSFKGGGTYPYMAPEAWKLESSSLQMDIYSLGIMFYQILTLELPFMGRDYNEWKDFHCFKVIPNISNKRSDVPVKLKEIIQKMTEKDKDCRYKNCNEIIEALKELKTDAAISNPNANLLANLISNTNSQIQKVKSEKEKEHQEFENLVNNYNYSISTIFSKIENIIEDTNRNVEENKIKYIYSQTADGLKTMNVTHMQKILSIKFFGVFDIKQYCKEQKERGRNFQKQKYGMVLYDDRLSFYEKNNIVLAGYVEIKSQFPLSLNLILIKDKKSDYGKWQKVSFDDIFVQYDPKHNYGFKNPAEFYKEYELSQSTHVRNQKTSDLIESDIQSWLIHLVQ